MTAVKHLISRYFSLFVVLLFLLPFAGATYLLMAETAEDIRFTQKELIGNHYSRILYQQLSAVHHLHDLQTRTQHDTTWEEEQTQWRTRLKEAMEAMEVQSGDAVEREIRPRWRTTKPLLEPVLTVPASSADSEPFFAASAAVRQMMVYVATESNLVLDPEIESYYLTALLTKSIPGASHELQAMVRAAGQKRGAMQAVGQRIGRIQELMADYKVSIEILTQNDPEKVVKNVEEIYQSVARIETLITQLESLISSRGGQQTLLALAPSLQAVMASLDSTHEMLSTHLDWHLQARIDREQRYRLQVFLLLLASLLVTTVIFWVARRNMVRQETVSAAENIRAILDTVIDAIVTIDDRGRIQAFNPAAERMFGYAQAEVLGENIRLLMPEPYRSAHDGYLARYHRTGQARIIGIGREVVAQRRNGETFPAEMAVNQYERNGQRMYVGSIRDISERKRTEAVMQQHAAQMEIKNIELEEAREQADAANRTKSEFLATVSHEIRTPMNGIIGMTDLLLDTELSPKQLGYATTVMGSAKALLALINDILDFSKNESGKMALESIPFDLKQLVNEVTQLLHLKALDKSIGLHADYDTTTPHQFLGDPTRVRQILTNLIDNAIKFTGEGEVRVTVRATEQTQEAAMIEVSVRDTGIGIPKDVQHKLFTKFSQADTTTTRKYGGTGLGLAICKQLAALMGGAIAFESEAGKGSRFWFTMHLQLDPDARPLEEAALPASSEPAAQWQGLRVLVAEDNFVNQFYMTELLQGLGMVPTIAANGKEAVEKASTEPFDAILMDCQMPEMDGYEATRLLRARMEEGGITRIPIIAMTANAMQGDREKCLAAGMDDYLSKPLERADLLRVLQARVRMK